MKLHSDITTLAQALSSHEPDISPSARTRNHAAVAIVLHGPAEGPLRCLLIKRAEHPLDPWSGQMGFPGGWKDPTDVSLEMTARRETEEEIGLGLTEEMLLGRLNDVETERLRGLDLSVASFVYYRETVDPLTPNEEVAEIVPVSLGDFTDNERHRPYIFPADPLQRQFPSIRYNGHVIWGLTYRVIHHLLMLTGQGLPGENMANGQGSGTLD